MKISHRRFAAALMILNERLQQSMDVVVGFFIPLKLKTFKSVSTDASESVLEWIES